MADIVALLVILTILVFVVAPLLLAALAAAVELSKPQHNQARPQERMRSRHAAARWHRA